MNSITTERFRKAYKILPEHIREQAIEAFDIWKKNERHPSLHFKRVHKSKLIYSARISYSHRAVGLKEEDTMIWFWIGSHSDYDTLIASL